MVTLTKAQFAELKRRAATRPQYGRVRGGRVPQRQQQQTVVRKRPTVPKGLAPMHHFNAFGPQKPQALAFSVGPATHVAGYSSAEATSGFGITKMVVFQPGVRQFQVRIYTDPGTGNWTSADKNINSTGFGVGSGPGSPDTIMCTRGSIRVRNVTRAADCGGIIRVLRVSTGLNLSTDAGRTNTAELIREHPRTHTYSGSSMTMAHQWDCVPVSQDKYHKFFNDNDNLQTRVGDPGLSTIIILVEPFTTSNDYEVTFAATYWARYNESGPLSAMAISPPTISLSLTNMARDAAEAVGSAGRKVGNMLLDTAANEIPGMIGNLLRKNFSGQAAGRLAGTAIADAEVLGPLALAM